MQGTNVIFMNENENKKC